MEDYYPDFKDFKISANEGNVFDECDRLRLFIKHKLIVSFDEKWIIETKLQCPSFLLECNTTTS